MQETRCEEIGKYILDNRCTIRYAAKIFNISKSTAHKDVSIKLKRENFPLFLEVKEILDYNYSTKHIRGGESTRKLYCKKKRGIIPHS